MPSVPVVACHAPRELLGAAPQRVAAERARVAQVGWGRRLLDLQVEGQWADGAYFPGPNWLPTEGVTGDPQGQPWTATMPTLRLLRDFGIDPGQAAVRSEEHTSELQS